MTTPTEQDIRAALGHVIDPLTGRDVMAAGLISGLTLKDGKAGFLITIGAQETARRALQPACEQAVAAVPGVTKVTAVLTAEAGPHREQPAAPPLPDRARAQWNLTPVENVRRLVMVASGKGGVGKSTVACGLALALAAEGLAVGLLDADIYGPSVPRMMGLRDKPATHKGKLVPPVAQGVQCLSIGLIAGDEAAILRGPMVGKALSQMLRGTEWGRRGGLLSKDKPLDVLLIDMPPGTGDIQLSLAQQAPLAYNGGGAVLVTTPQMVAVEDARKAAMMFGKIAVPLLGVVENMSYFPDPSTGEKLRLFGEGGGQALASEFGCELLAQLPLDPLLRERADQGRMEAAPFAALAKRLAARWHSG